MPFMSFEILVLMSLKVLTVSNPFMVLVFVSIIYKGYS